MVPDASSGERIAVKAQILAEQVDPSRFARQPNEALAHLLDSYTLHQPPVAIGFRNKMVLDRYIDLTNVPVDSDDERALAGHLGHHLRCPR
jgi:hypothetical protein